MGNDGGSIPTRRELVKEAARNKNASEVKESIKEQQTHLWNVDPLSNKPLATPVVSDALGRLFNKDSVIEFLLPSDESNEIKHKEQEDILKGSIKSLKDVVEVRFEREEGNTVKSNGLRKEKWICPITREELGPNSKAVYVVPCGHAFSAAAVKELQEEYCLQCNGSFAPNDVIPILPISEVDTARLTLRMSTLKENNLAHSLKKSSSGGKKRKKHTNKETTTESKVKSNELSEATDAAKVEETQMKSTQSSHAIKNAATASLTAKVLQEQEQRNKRRKMEENDNLNGLFSKKGEGKLTKKERDIQFMNRGFSITGK